MKKGEWTVNGSRLVFRNGHLSVQVDDVVKPDGNQGEYATVCFPAGVCVLPMDSDDNIYLTRQFRYAIGREAIEAVAGAIEDEEPLEAAKRELKEELGIEAEVWKDLGVVESLTSLSTCSSRLFLAERLSFGDPKPDGTEDIRSVKLPLSRAFEMVANGEITESDTCVIITRAAAEKEKWQRSIETAADLRTGGGAS